MRYDAIVLTGATGAVGSYIATHSQHIEALPTFCIVRRPESFEKLRRMSGKAAGRLVPIVADIAQAGDMERAAEDIGTHRCVAAIHCAGDVSWTKSERLLRPVNFGGSLHVASLLTTVSRERPAMVFLSTAFAQDGQAARNPYEITKLEAEHALRDQYGDRIDLTVLRCSLVVGASIDGAISRFNGLYPLVRIIALAEVPCVIADSNYRVDTIDLDFVRRQVDLALDSAPSGRGRRLLIAAAGSEAVNIRDLVSLVIERTDAYRAMQNLAPLPEISVIARRQYRFLMKASKSWGMEERFARVEQISNMMQGYVVHGESGHAIKPVVLGEAPPPPSSYLPNVIDFWLAANDERIRQDRQADWNLPEQHSDASYRRTTDH